MRRLMSEKKGGVRHFMKCEMVAFHRPNWEPTFLSARTRESLVEETLPNKIQTYHSYLDTLVFTCNPFVIIRTSSTWWVSWPTWFADANSATTPEQPRLQTELPPGGLLQLWLPSIVPLQEYRQRQSSLAYRHYRHLATTNPYKLDTWWFSRQIYRCNFGRFGHKSSNTYPIPSTKQNETNNSQNLFIVRILIKFEHSFFVSFQKLRIIIEGIGSATNG